MTVYPWDKWLDGRVWDLRVGKDFRMTVNRFTTMAENVAKGRGGRAVITMSARGRVRVQMTYDRKPTKQWQRYQIPIRRFPDKGVFPLHRLVEMRERGMTYREIAKVVGVSPQRIQQRLSTGRDEGLTFILIDKRASARPGERKGRRYGGRGEV